MFPELQQSLGSDRARGAAINILIGLVLFAGWLAWFFASRVGVYETTHQARLELVPPPHRVQTSIAGRVSMVRLNIGREVHAGDELLEIDVASQRLQEREERARLDGLVAERTALQRRLVIETQLLDNQTTVSRASIDEARAHRTEADAVADAARDRVERLLRMRTATSAADVVAARDASLQLGAAAHAAGAGLRRLAAERRGSVLDHQSEIATLQHDIVELDGQIATGQVTIERLETEIRRSEVRAPIDGRLGEIAPLRIGAVLATGDLVATILPAGHLQIVAQFAPTAAFGRVRVGQPGRLRLDGFPASEYGSIRATVATVADELRDGSVRVELALPPHFATSIPLQHGLPGALEVEVERVSPAVLLLRAIGRLRDRQVQTYEPQG